MTSRVQKGGTLFRPVAKPRGRQSTEPSVQNPSDDHTQKVSSPATSRNDSSMPPPSAIPIRSTLGLTESDHTTVLATISPQVSPSARRTSNLITPTKGSFIVTPVRNKPIPLVIGQSRSPSALVKSTPMPATVVNTIRTLTPLGESDSSVSTPSVRRDITTIPDGATADSVNTVADPIPPQSINSANIERHVVEDVEHQQAGPSKPLKRLRRARDESPASPQNADHSPKAKKATKRKKKVSADDQDSTIPRKRKKRSSLTNSSRGRKHREPTLPPYDPDAPGTDLDPTAVTMSNLCRDTGQGRVSSKATEIMQNHIAWKAANREKRARMVAIMEAKKYGRDLEEEEEAGSRPVETIAQPQPTLAPSNASGTETQDQATEGISTGDFDYSQAMSSSRYNVQVRIGPNGETIVDEESLFVDTNAEQDTEDYTHVEESDTTKFVNSATHSKKFGGSRWSAEETELFFDALSQFGENYELISYVLPGRDRKACKNKFKAEDKRNPARINHCLDNRVPYDIATLSRMTGKDFSGPTPVIRAPTPARMDETEQSLETQEPAKLVRKKSRTPAIAKDDKGEEVLGDAEDFEDKSDNEVSV